MTDEISFETLTGSGQADSTEISFEDLTGTKPVENPGPEYGLGAAQQWLVQGSQKFLSAIQGAVKTAASSSQEQTILGVGEAVASMATSIAAPVIAKARQLLGNKESYSELKKRASFDPLTEAGGSYAELIGAIPQMQTIGKATELGGKATEKLSGGVIPAEQATDAFNTALMFGGALDQALGKAKVKSHGAPLNEANASAVFDELAVKDPKGAKSFAEHIMAVDEALGKELKAKAKEQARASAKQQQEIGKKQVEAEAAGEVSFEELAKSDEVSYEDLIKQANNSRTVPAGNFRADLSAYTPKLYRETDADGALKFLGNTTSDMNTEMHFADTPDMAQGQGSNKGIMLELSSKNLQGRINLAKPTAEKAFENGFGEYIARANKQSTYIDNVEAITIKADADLRPAQKEALTKRLIKLEKQGWVKTSNEAGDVTYRKSIETKGQNNASSESSASLEAISRVAEENSAGRFRYKLMEDGTIVPLSGVDAVDVTAKQGQMIVQRVGDEAYEVVDRGGHSKESATRQIRLSMQQLEQLSSQKLAENHTRIGDGMRDAVQDGYNTLRTVPDSERVSKRSKVLDTVKDAPEKGLGLVKTKEGEWTLVKDRQPLQAYTDPVAAVQDFKAAQQQEQITIAAFLGPEDLRKLPGARIVEGKVKEYVDQAIRTFSPESLGPEAKKAGAIVAKNMAEQMQADSSYFHRGQQRKKFWNKLGEEKSFEFITKYERGTKQVDPVLQSADTGYRDWNQKITEQDARLSGISYEPLDNYLFHLFKDQDGVTAFFNQRYGSKWGNPKFIKDRTFDLYAEAVAAGFEPKFKNPEDIMQARQHASDVAQMRVQTLREMEANGLAVRITEKNAERPKDFPASEWRAPNGERYWVHDSAGAILENVFNTQSLWNMKGIVGDSFRGAMYLKNILVPIKLALSLFHPLHVLTIDNATGMVRASKELLSGESSPFRWMADMAKATAYKGIIDSPIQGNRLLNVWKGKVADADLTASDRTSLQYMTEGGFIPELSSQYRTKAYEGFVEAIQKKQVTAVFKLPMASLALLNKPIFEIWIPSLKIASYLKDAQTALKTDPSLASDSMARQLAFRKISKSVDNRYGEMAYGTLFWNRWVKDLAVANTLSLGWQLGFIREYGGGMMDLGQVVTNKGNVVEKASRGQLDRALFVSFYTAQALAYGGLMTWAMTGKPPNQLLDYTHPRTGEQNPDGSDARVNTMFYPREFVSIYKHMENEGVLSGFSHLVESKSSGLIGQVTEWSTGVNSFGQEIRDPDAPAFKQLEQTLAATLIDLQPISIGAVDKGQNPALAFAGFGPAPKYITESKTSGAIRNMYQKYYSQKQTPFDRAQYSGDAGKLKQYYQSGDSEKFADLVDKMREKYDLTGMDTRRLEKSVAKNDDPNLTMFNHFTWQQQKKLLDGMSETEREVYLPKANREHLRYNYQPPESP